MRRFTHYTSALFLAAASLFAVSCDDTDEVEKDPNDTTTTYDVTLEVDGKGTVNEDYTVSASTGATIKTLVKFTGSGMKRLYITTDSLGFGEEPFAPIEEVDLKPDGSVGLENSAASSFEFEFELPVPDMSAGTYVYRFWTTTGVGDFRETAKRLAAGVGSITIKFGGSNPDAGNADVKHFSSVKLDAPLADGSSDTFVSLVDGVTYDVNSGAEFASQWDIGYLFSVTADAATLRPAYNYPSIAIDIPAKSGVTNDELNRTYFKKSTEFDATEFAAVEIASDLDAVSVETLEANLKVVALAEGDIVEFVDNYGKKGLAKVLEIEPGNGAGDFIRIEIKVQP